MTVWRKPQLHVSALQMLYKCGIQFEYRYIKNITMAPGFAAVIGQAAHESVRKNLKAKITGGALLPGEEVASIARDDLVRRWREGVLLNKDDPPAERAEGEAIDGAVKFAMLHHDDVAPFLKPEVVEEPWVLELGGFPFDMAGTLDIREKLLRRRRIRDTKSTRRSPQQTWADTSEQLTLYSLAEKFVNGTPPGEVVLDYLVLQKKGVKYVELSSQRTEADIDMQFRRIEKAAETIEAGVFTPTDPQNWQCSEKWCGYWKMCPYAKRPVSVSPGAIDV